jgi:hypothetical protein
VQCGGLAVALARGLLAAAVLEVVLGLRGHAEFGYSDNYNYKITRQIDLKFQKSHLMINVCVG